MMARMPAAVGENDKVAQLRVKGPVRGRGQIITSYGTTGTVFFETRERAETLLRTNPDAFELLNGAPTPAIVRQPRVVGPTETKAPGEKKADQSSVENTDGRSTDSASSSAPGPAVEQSSSEVGQASTTSNAEPSRRRGRPPGKKRA